MPVIATLGATTGPPPGRIEALELNRQLHETGKVGIVEREAKQGEKGITTEIIFDPLAAAGVMSAVRVFSLWLKRDRRRTLTLTRTSGGENTETIELSGDAISLAVIESAVAKLSDIRVEGSDTSESTVIVSSTHYRRRSLIDHTLSLTSRVEYVPRSVWPTRASPTFPSPESCQLLDAGQTAS
jgi:hypothetical protein